MDKVMEEIQEDDVAVIGLHGIGGVGKTTLVKHVCAKVRENGIFNKVIMAVVSKSVDLKKIQAQLADMLALKFEEDIEAKEEGRAAALKKTILRGNKLLIILDDIWSKVPLSNIGIPENEELQKCNSKLLITTRMRKVCQEMNTDTKINLNVLSEEDSWKLFLKKARLVFDESSEIYSVARQVARSCAGVPVSLAAVARALRGEELEEWKKVAERLDMPRPVVLEDEKHVSASEDEEYLTAPEDENHVSAPDDEKHFSDLEDEQNVSASEDEKHVFNCIKLSYDYLKPADAKSFLLLCCLFPEDYDIPIEDLFRYGIGKGLFQDSHTLQEARDAADLVVKSLKSSNLLLDSEAEGCVKMHDVVRDVAISISSPGDGREMFVKSGQHLTEWPKISADMNYSAISLMGNQFRNSPEEMVCSKLVQILSLKSCGIGKFPENFFQSQNELMILDVRDNYIDNLSKSFYLLTNLRTLFTCNPSNTLLRQWSEIGRCKKLEILSFEFDRGDIPSEWGQLSNLRMLDISKPDYDKFPPHVISSLIRLEELYMKGKFIWGRKDHKKWHNSQTDLCCEEFIGLPNLNVLEVQIHDVGCLPEVVEFNPHWVYFDITFNVNNLYRYFADLPHRQRLLRIDTSINSLPDWFHKVVTERTERLVYYWFQHIMNILLEYGNGRLHEVKYLVVNRYNDASEWRELMNTLTWEVPDKPVFENLEELHVEDVPCVELSVGELPVGSFCNLKKFKVLDCLKMKNALLSSNLMNRLQNLEELVCGDLRSIECVFGTDGMEPEQQIIFTKLRKIHLFFLLKLTDLYCGPATPHGIFQNLKILIVSHCPSLNYVFPSPSVIESLVQLEELYVDRCPRLKVVIRASDETDIEDIIEFPRLKMLHLIGLWELKRFYGNSRSECSIINCPELEEMCFVGTLLLNPSSIRGLKEYKIKRCTYKFLRYERLKKESKTSREISWREREDEFDKMYP